MGITEIIISLIGGFFAGVINTLAGFGSIITLAIYMDIMGIAGHLANATNRINVFAGCSISTYTFYKNGKLDLQTGKHVIILVFAGAMVGIFMATQLDADGFKRAFKYILIPVLFILLLNPKRFIAPSSASALSPLLTYPLYFLLGIYAGFIQAGFGLLFLLIAVMMSKYDLVKANGLKVATVLTYTLVALIIFQFNGMLVWKAGLLMAAGQILGGYVAAKKMVTMKDANKYAYWLLVAIVILVIIKNFELWKYVF